MRRACVLKRAKVTSRPRYSTNTSRLAHSPNGYLAHLLGILTSSIPTFLAGINSTDELCLHRMAKRKAPAAADKEVAVPARKSARHKTSSVREETAAPTKTAKRTVESTKSSTVEVDHDASEQEPKVCDLYRLFDFLLGWVFFLYSHC